MSASHDNTRRASRHFRLLAGTSLLGLALAATPLTLSIDWQDSGVVVQTSEAKSCFTADTLVLLADGSEKAICDIKVGDRVLSGAGQVNRVVAVERPRLAGRKLYAFNGGAAFVTAEHPFLTPAGWKALDPAATAAENPALKVATLAIGDLLTVALPSGRSASGNLALALEVATSLLLLSRIEAQDADPQTIVYNLLLDGDHSYVANGFVVHNKGGESGGGGERGGEDRGGADRSGGGERGRDHAEDGGEHGDEGEHGEHAGDDHDEHGEGGELAEDDDDHQGRGRGRGRGGDDFFTGDPGTSDDPLAPGQEATAIENGWQ
jgi:Hom_end-associated Hint